MKHITYVLCIVLLFLSGCAANPDVILKGTEISAPVEETMSCPEEEPVSPEQEEAVIYVYICGAVQNPGVYEMSPKSRIYQLVDAAGGMAEDADEQSVNLAETVTDGQMVRIPFLTEAEGQPEEAGSAGISADGKVNINTASVEQLMSLNGIGEAKAEQIVTYREENGAFLDTEAIMQVSGIGQGTYEKIKNSITVQ